MYCIIAFRECFSLMASKGIVVMNTFWSVMPAVEPSLNCMVARAVLKGNILSGCCTA